MNSKKEIEKLLQLFRRKVPQLDWQIRQPTPMTPCSYSHTYPSPGGVCARLGKKDFCVGLEKYKLKDPIKYRDHGKFALVQTTIGEMGGQSYGTYQTEKELIDRARRFIKQETEKKQREADDLLS